MELPSDVLSEIEWTNDCQGKKDFDGNVVAVSSRYYPRGGGFDELSDRGWEGNESRPHIPPSAVSHIMVFGREWRTAKFTGSTEANVMNQVETWVRTQLEEIRQALSVLTPPQ